MKLLSVVLKTDNKRTTLIGNLWGIFHQDFDVHIKMYMNNIYNKLEIVSESFKLYNVCLNK